MQKLIVLLKRKPGLSLEKFRYYYEQEHIPMAAKHVGHLFADSLRIYINDLPAIPPEDGATSSAPVECPYDVVSVYSFRDAAAKKEFEAILGKPEVLNVLIKHEKLFLDRPACREGLCEAFTGVGMTA